MAEETNSPTQNISMTDETRRLIVLKQAEMLARDGRANFSAALREIVSEWAMQRQAPAPKAN
jgi:hypothetical protein